MPPTKTLYKVQSLPPQPLSSKQPLMYVLLICLFQTVHTNGRNQCVVYFDWFASLGIIFSRCIPTFASISIFFVFSVKYYSTPRIFQIHPTISWWAHTSLSWALAKCIKTPCMVNRFQTGGTMFYFLLIAIIMSLNRFPSI